MSELPNPNSFEEASQAGGGGLISDLLSFMAENKKWWLTPIILVLGLVGAIAVLAGSGAAPFIYTLF